MVGRGDSKIKSHFSRLPFFFDVKYIKARLLLSLANYMRWKKENFDAHVYEGVLPLFEIPTFMVIPVDSTVCTTKCKSIKL